MDELVQLLSNCFVDNRVSVAEVDCSAAAGRIEVPTSIGAFQPTVLCSNKLQSAVAEGWGSRR